MRLGLMEFAGVDKAARSKMGVWKMQEWKSAQTLTLDSMWLPTVPGKIYWPVALLFIIA